MDHGELARAAGADRAATEARIEQLKSQIALQEVHLAEVKTFLAMLDVYTAGFVPIAPEREWVVPEPQPLSLATQFETAQLSANEAEELERMNRFLGLGHAS